MQTTDELINRFLKLGSIPYSELEAGAFSRLDLKLLCEEYIIAYNRDYPKDDR